MKTPIRNCFRHALFAATAFGIARLLPAYAAEEANRGENVIVSATASSGDEEAPSDKVKERRRIVIERRDASGANSKREVAWLGLATEESSEAVTSQLGLKSGEGLVVTFVASNSPAAKAGLKRNDLLVEFEGQVLVLPAQFRKLVQMRKEGDTVKITFYRAGKRDEVSIKLGKTTLGFGFFGDDQGWEELRQHLGDLPLGGRMREEMQRLKEELAHAGIDKQSVQVEVKRSMEAAQKALQDVLRQATNAHRTFGPALRQIQELVRRGVDVDKDATVVVKSHRNEVKTIVQTDDTGTYVVVASPKKHLTAHDKSGKLTYDGEIETADQQAEVPKAIWEKVQVMLEQVDRDKSDEPELEAERSGV